MSIFSKASNSSYWRGFDYYENHCVSDLKKISNDVYFAKVKGTKTYEVKIDLAHPLNSTCTCPFVKDNHKMCKHMVAVAFSVCPDEVETANKIREEYYYNQEHKEDLLNQLMNDKEKEIREYVNSLSKSELKEELINRILNDEYDTAYKEIYGDDN